MEESTFLEKISPGMKVAVKANLVTFKNPDAAATTHPSLISALTDMIVSRGASVVIGDSPGGPYNGANLSRVYSETGMRSLEKAGVTLNRDFSVSECDFPQGAAIKDIPVTSYLRDADMIINFSKLKTHGFMGMSCAVKNMFGAIPGTRKAEFHYIYPQTVNFANMLIDLNECLKPAFSIVDGVVGMEGNGPTQGTPREAGVIIASESPYAADLFCTSVIGIGPGAVPTVAAAIKRGLCPPEVSELDIEDGFERFFISDFELLPTRDSVRFFGGSHLRQKLMSEVFGSRPVVDRESCIGCGECKRACPVETIEIVGGKAEIRRKECIRCFCCQEFCPVGAINVRRRLIARLLSK